MTTWTYEGYWNAVIGANRSAEDVIREFELNGRDRRGLDEWLGNAEAEASIAGSGTSKVPVEWEPFHAKALEEMVAA